MGSSMFYYCYSVYDSVYGDSFICYGGERGCVVLGTKAVTLLGVNAWNIHFVHIGIEMSKT
jgi:hypothetical protein